MQEQTRTLFDIILHKRIRMYNKTNIATIFNPLPKKLCPETLCVFIVEDMKPCLTQMIRNWPTSNQSLATMFKSMDIYSESSKTKILGLTTNTSKCVAYYL